MNKLKLTVALVAGILISSPSFAEDIAKRQTSLRNMCQQSLQKLYKVRPELKAKISKSPGYGCFSNFGVTVGVGGAGGAGLVHDNRTGKDTFMDMSQASIGAEIGVKNYHEVLIFNNYEVMEKFVSSGWQFSGDATAVASIEGGKVGASEDKAGPPSHTIDIYPMSRNGLAFGASIGERKYWKTTELN